MKTAALILSSFMLLRLLISAINYLWIRRVHSRISKQEGPWTRWSLLVPARNEENNIGNLLSDITHMDYQPAEIIIYDDNSTDNTKVVVNSYKPYLPQLKLMEGNEEQLPQGWLGKNRACHLLAEAASGEYLLFADADVRLGADVGDKWIGYAAQQGVSLLSVFPNQITDNRGASLTVPIMNWILLSLLPLPLVRYCSWSSFSAANGQFMLFKGSAYRNHMPHEIFRSCHAEDIAISRYFKSKKEKIITLTGTTSIRCRMYNGLEEALNGFSKNVFHFFGNSPAATVAFVLATTLTPLFLFTFGLWAYIIWLIGAAAIRVLVSAASLQNGRSNTELMFLQHYYFIIIVIKAFVHRSRKKLIWKGRNIY